MYAAFDGKMGDNLHNASQLCRELEITLDGLPVALPAGHRSLSAIRCYLETLALEKQRILCSLSVDGEPVNLALPLNHDGAFCRIDAGTAALKETSVLLLINDGRVARELWWNLARQLKEPVLTLSLLPDNACGPANGGASLTQLRKWQLEQVAAIIRDVDEACRSEDTIPLSNALENRVLPWLQQLNELISLWHDTAVAGERLGLTRRRPDMDHWFQA